MTVELLPASARPSVANRDTVWNVAYGSNLSLTKLQSRTPDGRRTITPLSQHPVTVPGWTLDFQLTGVPPLEPVMANARMSADEPTLHGVAYQFTKEDYDSLCMSEHCAIASLEPSYVEVPVTAVLYESGSTISAVVFSLVDAAAPPASRAPLLARYARPSERYIGLIRDGAVTRGLSPEYRAWLERLPTARPIRRRATRMLGTLALAGTFLVYTAPPLWRLGRVVKRRLLPYAVLVHALHEQAKAQGRSTLALALSAALTMLLAPLALLGAFNVVFVRSRVLMTE